MHLPTRGFAELSREGRCGYEASEWDTLRLVPRARSPMLRDGRPRPGARSLVAPGQGRAIAPYGRIDWRWVKIPRGSHRRLTSLSRSRFVP